MRRHGIQSAAAAGTPEARARCVPRSPFARQAPSACLLTLVAALAVARFSHAEGADAHAPSPAVNPVSAVAGSSLAPNWTPSLEPSMGPVPALSPAKAPGPEAKKPEATSRPPATQAPAGAGPRPDAPNARSGFSGSVTTRAVVSGGKGNDKLSSRLGLEWHAGAWTGGFAAQLENGPIPGAVFHVTGAGSLDIPERWIAWSHSSARNRSVQARLGTAYGVRFGQGLVLGSASFDGLQLTMDASRRVRVLAIAGRTETLDPQRLIDLPLELFPRTQNLGKDGRLEGMRVEMRPGDSLTFGVNALEASATGTPTARLFSTDASWTRGMVDVAAEIAAREDGGAAVFVRTDVTPSESWGLTIEGRRYAHFLSPLGAPPLYGGLSSGDAADETGGLLRADFSPTRRLSGSWSLDYSEAGGKTGAGVRLDHRLSLRLAVGKRTSLAWGFEYEDQAGGHDGMVQSLLATTAFEHGGRLAARLSIDRATPEPRDTLRTSYRLPLHHRKVTFLVDDTLRLQGTGRHQLQLGGSFRVGQASFLTVRGTLADDAPESVDMTWYRRF